MTGIPTLLAISLLIAPIQTAPPDAAPAEDQTHVTLLGQTYEIYPLDKLEARGVRVKYLPREENAAFAYFDALNLMPTADESIQEAVNAAAKGEWPEGELAERLNNYLDQCAPSLDIARRAAHMDEYFLPLFRGDSDSIYALLLPTLSPHRQLSRVFVADAHRRAAAGELETAFDELLTVQRMGNQMGHGATMIEGLVGISIGTLASESLANFAVTYDVNPDLLRETTAEMDALAEDIPTFEDLLRAEEAISSGLVDDMIAEPAQMAAISNVPAIGTLPMEQSNPGWQRLAAALRRVYLPDRAIKRNVKQYYKRLREGTRPQNDGTPGTVLEEDTLLESIPAWDVVNQATIPSLSNCYETTLRYRSNFERAKLRVAIAAYTKDHNRMPPTLDALAPRYVDRVEPDPMTGYDFEYRPEIFAGDGSVSGIVGLETVTRDNAEALRKKRRTPAILTPRASKWRRYARNYMDRYDLDASQRNSAESILRDVEARAAAFERSQGAKIKQLLDAGETKTAKDKMEPLDELFHELTKRLDRLPTARQRAAIAKSEDKED